MEYTGHFRWQPPIYLGTLQQKTFLKLHSFKALKSEPNEQKIERVW